MPLPIITSLGGFGDAHRFGAVAGQPDDGHARQRTGLHHARDAGSDHVGVVNDEQSHGVFRRT
jgi:hypothetical protein